MVSQHLLRLYASPFVLFVLAGCVSPPLALDPLPAISKLEMRSAPPDQDLTTAIKIERQSLDIEKLEEGVTARRDFTAVDGARVVISVPVEEQEREARQSGTGTSDTSEVGDGGVTSFKTTGYFNKAEQQIEKSLIGKSFHVQDRSKFEAKLRDRRTKSGGTVHSAAKQAEIRALDTKKESGELTIDEWAQQRGALEKKYESRSEEPDGRGRKQKELFDISELIRAAQEGDVQADYILQVNTFRTEQLSDRAVFLLEEPELEELCDSHPGLRETLQRTGSSTISQPGFFGLLNAKLIDVQTGVIHWVGEHRAESQRVFEDGYSIIVPITKRVSNASEIGDAIRTHNSALERKLSECQKLGTAAKSTEDSVAREQLAASYAEARRELARLVDRGPPAAARAEWKFEYLVGDVSTRPPMPTTAVRRALETSYAQASGEDRRRVQQLALRYKEFLNEHFSNLAKQVAKELISTIPARAEEEITSEEPPRPGK